MQSNEVSNPEPTISQTTQPQVGVPQQSVNETPERLPTEPILSQKTDKKWLLLGLISLVVVVLGTAGYFANQNYRIKQQVTQTQLTQTSISKPPSGIVTPTTAVPTTSPPITNILNWETYSNTLAGFRIKYPTGWRRVEAKSWAGFGPQEIGEDVVWGVSFYNKSEKTIPQIKDDMGKQFSDRKQTEETTSFDELSVIKVVTTTNQFADWYSVTIIIDSGNMLYAIGNGAQTDRALNEMITKRTGKPSSLSFKDFYTSFEPITKLPVAQTNTFNFKNFTIDYPNSWTFSDMSVDQNFPLKERLSSLYSSNKVIALSKSGIFLIITIEQESEGGSGGIFLNDEEYEKYISDKDKIFIGDDVFYLNRNHNDISYLAESHSGPYGWSALTEYIPKKLTPQTEMVYKGYENIIKRNGYAYNFIIASDKGGQTPTTWQLEVIPILQSIIW